MVEAIDNIWNVLTAIDSSCLVEQCQQQHSGSNRFDSYLYWNLIVFIHFPGRVEVGVSWPYLSDSMSLRQFVLITGEMC